MNCRCAWPMLKTRQTRGNLHLGIASEPYSPPVLDPIGLVGALQDLPAFFDSLDGLQLSALLSSLDSAATVHAAQLRRLWSLVPQRHQVGRWAQHLRHSLLHLVHSVLSPA